MGEVSFIDTHDQSIARDVFSEVEVIIFVEDDVVAHLAAHDYND